MNKTDCKIWVQPVDREHSEVLKQVLPDCDLTVLYLPTLDDLLDSAGTEEYVYTKTYKEAMSEPLCVLHSSGSTGLPKSIIITHGLAASMDAINLLPPIDGDHGFEPWSALFKEDYRIFCPNQLLHVSAVF